MTRLQFHGQHSTGAPHGIGPGFVQNSSFGKLNVNTCMYNVDIVAVSKKKGAAVRVPHAGQGANGRCRGLGIETRKLAQHGFVPVDKLNRKWVSISIQS